MSLTKDDLRAAISAGTITEAQAAGITALSDARRGARENLAGVDEPFELFKGFNEIFIVIGLTILYIGWNGVTGVAATMSEHGPIIGAAVSMISIVVLGVLTAYFTLKRRMVAPSIALTVMTAISSTFFCIALSALILRPNTISVLNVYSLEKDLLWYAAGTTLILGIYWFLFRIPFTMFLIAIGVFVTVFALTTQTGAELSNPEDLFLLTGQGPFALITVALGVIGFAIALAFDMSDPHRVTRRAVNGFWLHIIAAPAIVNTVALTLFQSGTALAYLILIAFLAVMAILAIAIDRRSFLVSGIGYIVALAITVAEGNAFLVILFLGMGLTLLGAFWEQLRRAVMNRLPNLPGKSRLPPWQAPTETT